MATCKLGEKGCWKDGKCHYSHDCENKVLTNADRIRAMTDAELANVLMCPQEFFGLMSCPDVPDCTSCKREWLQQPAEVQEG